MVGPDPFPALTPLEELALDAEVGAYRLREYLRAEVERRRSVLSPAEATHDAGESVVVRSAAG